MRFFKERKKLLTVSEKQDKQILNLQVKCTLMDTHKV